MSLFSGAVVLGVILAALTVGVLWKKSNVLELLVLGAVYWCCAWVVAGMGLFVLDAFRLFRCACAADGLVLLTGIAAVLVRRKREGTPLRQMMTVSWDIRPYWIPMAVCAVGFVLVAVKHELFGMGQDEGVYQTVAINLMNGIADRQQDFAEYHSLPEAQQEIFSKSVLSHLVGYDIGSESYPDTVYDNTVSPVSGIYHGIPTFASMLAMWGTMFGMAQMQGIQTVFYGMTIFLTFFLCRNLKLRQRACALACVVTAASPVVVWVAKSALTEGFLAVLIVLFLYFLTDEAHPERQWMSILPVAVFGCYHVSIYTMVPLFLVLYGGMYWLTRRKCFAVLMPVTVVGYLVSFFAMRHVQPFYTMNNYSPIFGLGITQKELPWFVPLVCGAALVLCGGYLWAVRRFVHRKYADSSPERYLERVQQSRMGFVLVELLLVPLMLYILLKCVMAENPLSEFRGSSLWGFACAMGILLPLLAWIMGVLKPRFYLESPRRLVILVTAVYCVLFYAAFLRFHVNFFYYYGRYLVPFLPAAAVFSAMTIERLRARVTIPVMAAGLLVVAPYDRFLAVTKDDTRMQWNVLEEIAAQIQPTDCVIVDGDNMWTLFLPLRAMTGAAVYPLTGDPEIQAEQLRDQFEADGVSHNIYYLGTGKWTESFEEQFRLVYTGQVTQISDDDASNRTKLIPFPLAYPESRRTISLYRCWTEELSYEAAGSGGTEYGGFHPVEGSFCWSNAAEAAVRCSLEKKDYTMTVEMGCAMPLKEIGYEAYPVDVLVNGQNVGQLLVDDETNGKSFSLDVPAELLSEGVNLVTLECELWEASRVSAGDVRLLGFPLKSLVFAPTA